jgi:hypothetical protein
MPVSSTAGLLDRESPGLIEQPSCCRGMQVVTATIWSRYIYLSDVPAPHQLTYTTRDLRFNLRHRGAKLGAAAEGELSKSR